MKKKINKICASLLAVLMVVAFMPVLGSGVYADDYDYHVTTSIPDQTYTGEAPDLSAVDELAEITTEEGVTMVRGEDFTVATEDYHVMDDALAVFTGIGNYEGKQFAPVYFKIVEAATTNTYEATIDSSKIIYTGAPLTEADAKAAIKIIKNGNTRLDPAEFDVAVTAPSGAKGDVGEKYTVKVTVVGSGTAAKPEFTTDLQATIAKKDIQDEAVIEISGTYTYDGTAKEATVASVMVGDETLAPADYTVTYKDNVNASAKAKAIVTVKDSCKNFTGSAEQAFVIAPADLAKAKVIVTGTSVKYNGKVQKPEVEVKAYFENAVDAKVIPATDYQVKYIDSKEIGDYDVTLIPATGVANLTGESGAQPGYKITPASFKDDVTVTAKKDSVPAGTDVAAKFDKYYSVMFGDIKLAAGEDFSVAYTSGSPESKVGFECTLTLTPTNDNFVSTEKQTVTYTVGPKDFAKLYYSDESFEYNGDTITPSASDLGTIYAIDEDENVVNPTDYIVMDWSNNVDATNYSGDDPSRYAQAKIEGLNEHKGQSATVLFVIDPKDVSEYTIAAADLKGLSAGKYYEGMKVTGVSATLKKGSESIALTADDCYAVIEEIVSNKITEVTVYTVDGGNYDAGEDGILVTGLNIQSSPATLNDAVVSTEIPAGLKDYDPETIQNHISVTVGGNEVEASAYELDIVKAPAKYEVGAEIKVQLNALTTGSAQIAGSKDATLKIAPRDISEFEKSLDLDHYLFEYSGKEFKPALNEECESRIQDEYDAKQFQAGTDYEITYKDNVNAGKATATVTGKGDYTGSVDLTFEIEKAFLEDEDVEFTLPSGSAIEFAVGPVKDLSSQITMKAASGKSYVIDASDYTVALKDPKQEVKSTDSILDPITVEYVITISKDSKNYISEVLVDYDEDAEKYIYEPVTLETSYDLIAKTVRNAEVTLEKGLEYKVIPTAEKFDQYDIGKVTVKVDGQELTEGTDFVATKIGSGKLPSQRAAGDKAPYVEIKFQGNYAGIDASTKVNIVADTIDLSQVKLVEPKATDLEYTGSAKKVEANDIGDVQLPVDSWIVEYSKDGKVVEEAVEVGTYKATIKATEDYGSAVGESIEFTITPEILKTTDFNDKVAALSIADVEYLGTATKTPKLVGQLADQFEIVSFDQTWDGDAAKQGKAVVALKEDANYAYDGTGEVKFTWKQGDIANAEIEVGDLFEIEDQIYTGKALTPALKAKSDISTDCAEIQYYENNTAVSKKTAKAFVVVKMENDPRYTGTLSGFVVFSIVPDQEAKAAAAEEAAAAIEAAAKVDDSYPADYKAAVEEAKAAVEAKVADENATAEDIKAAIEALNKAVADADEAKAAADKRAEDEAAAAAYKEAEPVIAAANKITADKYTAASVAAIAAAKDELAKATTAETIKAATAKLQNAIDSAVKLKATKITVKPTKKTIKAKKLEKAKKTFKLKAKVNSKAKAKFKKVKGNKGIKVSKTGKVTVKKGLKKGTYKIKIKVTTKKTATYKAGKKNVTLKIKVK